MPSLRSVVSFASLCSVKGANLRQRNPGAGMDPKKIEESVYDKVYKDGYAHMGCIPDGMLLHGDKFGDNKAAYKLGDVSGVSIVHYTDVVAKLDQKPMTHDVCYQFCRTIHDMHNFGITNGRDCYCTPYSHPVASDSSACDAPCDGDKNLMCGGKTKSDMFTMYFCDDTAEDLKRALEVAHDEKQKLKKLVGEVGEASSAMQGHAEKLQPVFGKVGDSVASGYCQSAKQFAGELEKAIKFDFEAVNQLLGLAEKAKVDSSKPQNMEKLTVDLKEAYVKMKPIVASLNKLKSEATVPKVSDGAAKLFYPAMYFADKKFEEAPQVCGGETSARPIVVESEEECATACLSDVEECVGFQSTGGLCFLLKTVKSLTYYTGCKEPSAPTTCRLKLASFQGLNLTPDKSGKNKLALKELNKADRCF